MGIQLSKHYVLAAGGTGGHMVPAAALAEHALVPPAQTRVDTEAVAALLGKAPGTALPDPWAFLSGILGWRAAQVAGSPGGPAVPDGTGVSVPVSTPAAGVPIVSAVTDEQRGERGEAGR